MELNIGHTILKLRKEKKVTQEQLAEAVGVSTSAVSKWEIGSAYPDITMLPSIARFFNTNIDSLLNYKNELPFESIVNIGKECVQTFEKLGFSTGFNKCKKYVREYPNSTVLKYHMAMVIFQFLMTSSTEMRDVASEISIKWLKQSAEIQNPMAIRYASLHYLNQFYMYLGRTDEAINVVKDIPNEQGLFDLENDLASAYLASQQDEKAELISQQKLYLSISYVHNALANLITIACNRKNYDYALELLDKQKQIILLFQMDDSLFIQNASHRAAVNCHAGYQDEALSALEEVCNLLSSYETKPLSENKLFEKTNYSANITTGNTLKEAFLNALLENSVFEAIENTDRYKAILKGLKLDSQEK